MKINYIFIVLGKDKKLDSGAEVPAVLMPLKNIMLNNTTYPQPNKNSIY